MISSKSKYITIKLHRFFFHESNVIYPGKFKTIPEKKKSKQSYKMCSQEKGSVGKQNKSLHFFPLSRQK